MIFTELASAPKREKEALSYSTQNYKSTLEESKLSVPVMSKASKPSMNSKVDSSNSYNSQPNDSDSTIDAKISKNICINQLLPTSSPRFSVHKLNNSELGTASVNRKSENVDDSLGKQIFHHIYSKIDLVFAKYLKYQTNYMKICDYQIYEFRNKQDC